MKSHALWRSAEYNGGMIAGLAVGVMLTRFAVSREHWLRSEWTFWIAFAAVLIGGEIAQRGFKRRLRGESDGSKPETRSESDVKTR